MPRPDLARLGVNHRRIPILSIGRDVYLDTRLIIDKLEQATDLPCARGPLGSPGAGGGKASSPEHRALEQLLRIFVVDGGVFARAAQLIPHDLPLMRDRRFVRDRNAFFPGGVAPRELQPEALTEVQAAMRLLESTLLSDGRAWLLGGGGAEEGAEGPSLADLEAVWPLVWLTTLPGALPADRVSAAQYPRVWAWMDRFKAAVKRAAPREKPPTIKGDQAAEAVVNSPFREAEGAIDGDDATVRADGLAKGQVVTVWPLDSGSSGRDVGRLVSIDEREVVIEVDVPGSSSGASVRVHAPRRGFRVRPHVAEPAAANL